MNTYQDLEAELYNKGHGGWMASRNVANHTKLVRDGENVAVRFHQTNVLTYFPDNRVVLNHGGWDTTTTKARMNSFLGVNQISSWYRTWHVHVNFRTNKDWGEPQYIEAFVPYENGMVLNATTGELAEHPSAKPLDLDNQVTAQMRDANRALAVQSDKLHTKVRDGSLSKSDLVYASMMLDRHKEHTARLAGYLRQMESGANYTVERMEDSLESAVKYHAKSTMEMRERAREVRGQTRLSVLS